MEIFDLGIIGAGVAGAFACLRLSQQYPNVKTVLFDLGKPPGKRRRQIEGWLGSFPAGDGRLYQKDIDNLFSICDGRRIKAISSWVLETLNNFGTIKFLEDKLPLKSFTKKTESLGFQLSKNNNFQWKPESIHALSKFIADELEKNKNITTSFDNEVYNISFDKVFTVQSSQGIFQCKKILLSPGRSGWRWLKSVFNSLNISYTDDYARMGVIGEVSSSLVKEINQSHCTLIKNDLTLGPFSWKGTIIPEDHADSVISAFRSNEDRWKTDKVTFSILKDCYFKGKGSEECDRLAKLAFLLFNDRVTREKVSIYMKKNTQLNMLEQFDWLHSVFKEVDNLIPGFLTKGSFHVPHIYPMPPKVNLDKNLQTEIEGLYLAGESAGVHGILAASMMGGICIDGMFKD